MIHLPLIDTSKIPQLQDNFKRSHWMHKLLEFLESGDKKSLPLGVAIQKQG